MKKNSVKGVKVEGVINDKKITLEESEVSHTLGGVGKGRVQGTGKWRGCR